MVKRGHTYFDHQADIGVEGFGETLEEAFEEAARALFDLMIEVDSVDAVNEIAIECDGSDVEELFVEWLNALLAQADIHLMAFNRFRVEITDGRYLKGSAAGEPFSQEKHQPKLEVKAATYSMLSVTRDGETWRARCVVDV
jgi:SHS2 domain-containing protein